jgi:WXG100 family type VII secretion target
MADPSFMKVNFGVMAAGVADLEKAVAQLDAKLADLHRQAQPLVNTWDGDAKQAYATRQQAWTKSAEELKTVLNQIKGAMGQSLANYQATEARVKKSFV